MKIFSTVIALLLLLSGCAQQKAATTPIWVAVNRPQEFKVHCMQNFAPKSCYFSIGGFWRSTSGPGSEISSPDVVSIVCSTENKNCVVTEASVNDIGKLEADSYEFDVSLWTDDQIIATTIGGLCDIGNQIVVDIRNQTVMRRTYPTKPQTAPCDGAFAQTDTYVLHTGYWQLQPMVGKTFQGKEQ